jgi:hypothetical protein
VDAPSVSGALLAQSYGSMVILDCYLFTDVANGTAVNLQTQSNFTLRKTKVYSSVGSGSGLKNAQQGLFTIQQGTKIDNFDYGAYINVNATLLYGNALSTGYCRIENCTTGIYALTGGQVTGTANNQYSGNSTDETADSASYGYID